MEKILFKNHILNIVLGSLLVIVAVLSYVLGWMEDFLPYVVAAILFLLSSKRFFYTYKKIETKSATLILILEYILDLAFVGLLVYYQDHIEIFVGLLIYVRGVAYLLINYTATRKINFVQYITNIGYVTLGSFFLFYPATYLDYIVYVLVGLIAAAGLIFLIAGISTLTKNKKAKQALIKEETPDVIEEITEEQSVVIEETPNEVTEIEAVVAEPEVEAAPEVVQEIEDTPEEAAPVKIQYSKLKMVELRKIAKEKGLSGYSQMNKAELVKLIKNA